MIVLGQSPFIDTDTLPQEEKPHAEVIRLQLSHLAIGVSEFEAALKLFDACLPKLLSSERGPYGGWMSLAGRAASVTLWNFMQAGQAIKANLDETPTLRGAVKVGAVDGALKQFHETFPDAKTARDAIGHAAEKTKTPKTAANNESDAFKLKGVSVAAGNWVSGNFSDRTFFSTGIGGKLARFDLSEASLEALTSATDQIYRAFPNRRGR